MEPDQPRACPQHSTPAFDCIGKECRYYNDDGSCGYAALLLVSGKLADALYVPLKAVIAAIEQALPVFNLQESLRQPKKAKVISTLIDGVKIKHLKRHVDERGYVMEILRRDDELFTEFGQAYISACFPGMVKAWHCHEIQTDHFCCIQGNAKIGLYDDRPDSPTEGETQSIVIGELNPALIRIPTYVWHGMMALGGEMAVILNVPTEPYNAEDPDELRRDPFDPEIPFDWDTKGG